MGSIYNIPASLSAVDVLAEKFLAEYAQEPLALADVCCLPAAPPKLWPTLSFGREG